MSRAELDLAYLIVTGAGTARRAPELAAALVARFRTVYTLLTPNASRVVSPRELQLVPGNQVIESYFDTAILPRPPLGLVLIAPCSFNSLNKLTWGIADNLALSVAAEAIGRGTPVVVAVSTNVPLWVHPRALESTRTLRAWGATVLEPVPDGETLTLAPLPVILDAVSRVNRGKDEPGAATGASGSA